jgi:hypothetical protein
MPVIQPRWIQLSFALLVGAGAVGACSVDHAAMDTAPCLGLSCNRGDLTMPSGTDVAGSLATPDAAAEVAALLKPVCGAGSCVPDQPLACASYVPPPVDDPSGSADPSADSGLSLDAGAGADPLDGGLDGGAGEPPIDGSYPRPSPPDPAPSAFACQLSLSASNRVERKCGAAGSQGIDEACTSSLDCQPGLGCVGAVRAGRCLPFCCGLGTDTCAPDYYCAQRPLRSLTLGEADGPLVPVCDRAEYCSLGEPVNCTGEHCVCAAGAACTVVRPDGTTACVPEGQGDGGDPCPCKWGFHCSQATSPATCVKTCELNGENTCGAGICQGTPLLPDGWGTCVGASQAQMAR